jgi:predicted nucleotidyltransferase
MESDLATMRQAHVAALTSGLDQLVAQLREIPEVRQVVLFGSYAQGRRDLFTDLDLLVVMDSPLDFVTRNAELAGRLRAGIPLDLVAYTPEEMESMRERPFLRHALADSKVLYACNTA